MIRAEPLLEHLSLILVNSSDTMINNQRSKPVLHFDHYRAAGKTHAVQCDPRRTNGQLHG